MTESQIPGLSVENEKRIVKQLYKSMFISIIIIIKKKKCFFQLEIIINPFISSTVSSLHPSEMLGRKKNCKFRKPSAVSVLSTTVDLAFVRTPCPTATEGILIRYQFKHTSVRRRYNHMCHSRKSVDSISSKIPRLEMTEILLKRRKTLAPPSIMLKFQNLAPAV